MRPVTLFRRPPNPGSIPRTTGLSAGGLTTTVTFVVGVVGTAEGMNASGWARLTVQTAQFSFSPNNIFAARTDSIKGLLALYSEFRINRITAHWIPSIGTSAHGRLAFSLVDAGYGYANGMTYADVVTTPNSSQTYVGQRSGRSWVPTEPNALDWRGPTDAAAHLIYAAEQVFAPIGIEGNKDLGQFFVRVNLSLRSPTQHDAVANALLQAMQI